MKEPVIKEVVKERKKVKFPKALLFLLGFLLFAGITYYLIFNLKIFENQPIEESNEETQEEETIEETEDDEIEMAQFQGEYISTNLPLGWSITEYTDGEGTDMLTPGTYSGLTGLKIFKEDTEIFYMQAVSGLGFAGCPNYAKFDDESTTYYQQLLVENEVSGEVINITDYTDTAYEEFTLLGLPFRRIGKTYLYDVISGNNYFEPPCVPSLVAFYDLTLYRAQEGPGSSTYDYGATDEATPEDLLVVDQILQDIALTIN